MKQELFKLVTLHQFDRDIRELKAHLDERQLQFEQHQQRLETAKGQLEEKMDALKREKVRGEEIETDIKASETRYKECSYQLLNLKDQKSYDAMKMQLQDIRESIDSKENEGLETLNKVEELNKTVEMYQGKIDEEVARLEQEEKDIAAEREKQAPELEAMVQKRTSYAEQIAKPVLDKYEKLLSHADKKPMVELDGRSCTGCYSEITLDAYERVKMMEEVVTCLTCGKIVYSSALLGAAEE